jgi:hypothetical protein
MKSEGQRPLGKRRCRWEDNTKIELKEISWEDLNWISFLKHAVIWRAEPLKIY